MSDEPDNRESGAPGRREKLIVSKQAWAREGRLLTGKAGDRTRDRLPPGQRLVRDWPVLDLGVTPKRDLEKWRLRIDGAVANRVIWDWAAYQQQPRIRITTDIHCVTGWSRYDNAWEGVSAARILDLVQPHAEATHCIFYSRDGYTTNVRLDRFADDDVLLAHSWEGKPLSQGHGGPVRVVMPKWYLWKSAKWLRRIRFATEDEPGYWEIRGYHNDGDPWKEERYSDD